jgi:hypothetical protein
MLCNSVVKFTLTLYNSKSRTTFIFVMFLSGHLHNRCLAAAIFVKEAGDLFHSFSGVMRYPDHGTLLCCHLTGTRKHVEQWGSAVVKVKSWTFPNNESGPMHPPPPSQTGCSAACMEEAGEPGEEAQIR